MMCPDCSPPRTAPSLRRASRTYRSPTAVVITRTPRSCISRWKPRFVIWVTATVSTSRSSARIARIWSPSTVSPAPSTASMRSPSPSNAIPRSAPQSRTVRESGRPAAHVDVGAVGLVGDARDLGSEPGERLRRDARVRAVRAVDHNAQAAELAAEAFEHVIEVALRGDADPVDRSSARRLPVEERLDLFLRRVDELPAVAVEELDAVVLRRVVRGGDHDAEVEREQCNRGRR